MIASEDEERARIEGWRFALDALADTVGTVDLAQEPIAVFRALPDSIAKDRKIAYQVLLATVCLAFDRESQGLEILGDQRLVYERFPTELVDPIRWLCGCLSLNAGATKVAQNQFGDALGLYIDSLHVFSSLKLASMRSSCLERVLDLVRAADSQMELLVALYNYGLEFERSMSTVDLRDLQKVHRLLNAALVEEQINNASQIGVLWQISKGLRFATIAYRGIAACTNITSPDWLNLGQMLEAALAEEPSLQPITDLDTELGLLTYAESVLDAHDASEKQALNQSARVRYDQMLDASFVEAAINSRRLPFEQLPLLSDASIQEVLGTSTILVNLYLGQSLSGQLTMYLMLLTAEERQIAAISAEGMSNLAVEVASVRHSIQKDPPFGETVTLEALGALQKLYGMLFSRVTEILERLYEAGKRHLCIVPHGPLHFLPFHLLGPGTEPLAARWIVTYLPNLALLNIDSRRPAGPLDRKTGVMAFACAQWHGYESLPEAVEEAVAIARVFGAEPLLEDKFDLDHLVAALSSGKRYVHIAGHGVMDVAAPCFHHVLMAPRHGENQKLYAFQLQGLDLRGIELVTLSSCETALGRFDISDNLRGFPAYLFLCGASAIVGTLWQVESNSALTFFTQLYARLNDGENRLEAFAHAQRVTRERHPEYRDWGAFCYLGDWTTRKARLKTRSIPGIPSIQFRKG